MRAILYHGRENERKVYSGQLNYNADKQVDALVFKSFPEIGDLLPFDNLHRRQGPRCETNQPPWQPVQTGFLAATRLLDQV